MREIKKIIQTEKPQSYSDFISLYKRITKDIEKNKLKNVKKIKISILSSFTIKGIEEILYIKCCELGIIPNFYIGDYNQYHQEILDENKGLYKFDPDLIFILIDIRELLGDLFLVPYQLSDKQRKKWVNDKKIEIHSLISKLQEKTEAKVIFNNFEVPVFSPLGIIENKQEFGLIESIESLNRELKNIYQNDSQVFIFDFNTFSSNIGKQNLIDYKMYYIGDIKINMKYIPNLCDSYLGYIRPIMSQSKKCIVLDLDNTLWGGIIGEEGIDGIKLGPTVEGRPFFEFQKYILSLFNRGVMLAINSKNNPDDVLQVLREHPYMILKEEHFATMKINWNDKISNMKDISDDLNIGMDSFVFFDDDMLNREMIRDAIPEILVVDLPKDPSLYLQKIMNLNVFDTFQLTDEDKIKGKMYAQQRTRKTFQKSVTDISEYLKGLDMVTKIEKANSFTIPRISQLTQKTNQFNMTTRRYLEEDIIKFSNDKDYLVASIKVEDKFGDNGITGVTIVKKETEKWKIDTFLLSCRVIGRSVENTLLAYIIEQAKKDNIKEITGEFIPTKKNIPAKDFFKNNNFKLKNKIDTSEEWTYRLDKNYSYPDFIKVVKDE